MTEAKSPGVVARNPVMLAGSLVSLVSAVLIAARAFGVVLTDEQFRALLEVAGVAGPIAGALWARRRVTPDV